MDPTWNTFAAVCRKDFGACSFASDLIRECGGDEDIAWAAYFHLRDERLHGCDGAFRHWMEDFQRL